jgi:hypothetical protein
MDPNRFDTVTRSLAGTGTRRALLHRLTPLPVAGILTFLLGQETTEADGSGAIVGGGRRKPNRHRNHHRREHHKRKHHNNPEPMPPEPICPGLGLACSTPLGTECCPDIDPNVVCAGGPNPATVCQDCTAPMTAAGAFCQDSPGNQCCGGNPMCFVGVRVDPAHQGQPVCLCDGSCSSKIGVVCEKDAQCAAAGDKTFTICVKTEGACCEGETRETRYCGKPCGAATCGEE